MSLHVHERIDPKTIVQAVKKKNGTGQQPSLFEEQERPLREEIEFYKHRHGWTNRLVAGDSLLVMNSLLEKEGMAGKVQMIYIDPPYGIKYGSNFQPFVNKRNVIDGKDEDLTSEPETLKAFRDTWELGIHSYLTYMRDRLLLARELLHESGSCFVQISDENVHLIRCLMGEVFGVENFVSLINFRTTAGDTSTLLPTMGDFIIFFAKNKNLVKYRDIFVDKSLGVGSGAMYSHVESPDGTERRKITKKEILNPSLIPEGWRAFRVADLKRLGFSNTSSYEYELDGKQYYCGQTHQWKTNKAGMDRLKEANWLIAPSGTLQYKRYYEHFPISKLGNLWIDTQGASEKTYAVQTSNKVIQRCLLMTTDPGDLVLDLTCVRAGTRVLVAATFTSDGVGPPFPPVNGGATLAYPKVPIDTNDPHTLTLRLRGAGVPLLNHVAELATKSIEDIRPGDWVYAHDGNPHRVVRTLSKTYQGTMVGVQTTNSEQVLWTTEDHYYLCLKRKPSIPPWIGNKAQQLTFAQQLRKQMTASERKLWYEGLAGAKLGFSFRKQRPVGPYVLDFFCKEKYLAIELDGETHRNDAAANHDTERDAFLAAAGINVLRIPSELVFSDWEQVLELLSYAVGATKPCEMEGLEWRRADTLLYADSVCRGKASEPVPIHGLHSEKNCNETVYDLEVEGAHSFVAEGLVVHNCGSGTTAYVAEQWGRRWLTCDTSRVAITLAKQRLMTATFDYYKLVHPHQGVGSGFVYKTVPYITLKSIANNEPPAEETLYDQPLKEKGKGRITGPFTVEAVPAPFVKPLDDIDEPAVSDVSVVRSGETLRQRDWMEELQRTGIRGKAGQRIQFTGMQTLSAIRNLHATAMTLETEGAEPQVVVVSFGPQYAPLEQRQVELALEDARKLRPMPTLIVFAAFQFDPEAAKDIDETNWPGITLLKVQMNADLLTDDLKKKRSSNESFWLIGQPDIVLTSLTEGEHAGKFQIEVLGFDYYDTLSGAIISGNAKKIATWMLDTDYDGRSVFPHQVFFPMAGDKDGWKRLSKSLHAEIDDELIEAYHGAVSLPFEAGEYKRAAVKIVDDRGIESLKILELPKAASPKN